MSPLKFRDSWVAKYAPDQGYQPPINNEIFPYICYVLLPLQFYRLVSDGMTMVAQDLFGFRVCVLVNDTIFYLRSRFSCNEA